VTDVDTTTIGPYATVRMLAESPHGAVYLATGHHGRQVALTVLDGTAAADQDTRQRFASIVNEAPTALVGADLTGGRPWAAQPYPPSVGVGPLLAQLGGPVREVPGAPVEPPPAEPVPEPVPAVEPWAPRVLGRRLTPQLVAVVAAVAVIAMFLVMFTWALLENLFPS
jgi:hypothetical protein